MSQFVIVLIGFLGCQRKPWTIWQVCSASSAGTLNLLCPSFSPRDGQSLRQWRKEATNQNSFASFLLSIQTQIPWRSVARSKLKSPDVMSVVFCTVDCWAQKHGSTVLRRNKCSAAACIQIQKKEGVILLGNKCLLDFRASFCLNFKSLTSEKCLEDRQEGLLFRSQCKTDLMDGESVRPNHTDNS